MEKVWIFVFCFSLTGCQTGQTPSVNNDREINTVIHLTEAISKAKPVYLSEIVDSISFIALETTPDCLIGNALFFNFSQEYIFSANRCFDWSGKFIGKVGRRGNGPCEESAEIITKVIYNNNYFYTNASKFIEYDSLMQCTGKERSMYRLDGERPMAVSGEKILSFTSMANAKENMILYNYPDSVYFFDTDFNIITSECVMASQPLLLLPVSAYNPNGGTQFTKYTTNFGDISLFYNYLNDTIYYINNTYLSPAWIVELNDDIRVPKDLVYRHELLSEAVKAWENGNLENSELIRLTDHKFTIMAVYETSRYVLLVFTEIIQFHEIRKKEPAIPQIAFFDKQTGKTVSTKVGGFVDDMIEMDMYLPEWGACNNMLIKSIWPYELLGYVDECKRSGRKVSQQIMDLVEKIDIEDNPILIVAHLKK